MFLTLEDPRAKVQGSRDPLGVQPVWAAFGRHVVANLTTQSTSVRGFTTLLLGRYFGEQLVGSQRARDEDVLAIFLRTEQVCAYARHIRHEVEGDIRGIERVSRNARESTGSVRIGDEPACCIMSDQKTYGLWGLYSVPARVSGLITDGPVGLTPRAREFVERHYVPQLRPVETRLIRLLLEGGELATSKGDVVLKAVASVLGELTGAERTFYAATLRDATFHTSPELAARQQRFAALLLAHADLNTPADRAEVLALAKHAAVDDETLAMCLRRIAALEAFFAPAEAMFEHLQVRHGQPVAKLADLFSRDWGPVPHLDDGTFTELRAEIEQLVGADMAAGMARCYAALATSDYAAAIESLLDWNRFVMARRGAASWIRLSDGKLDVRYRGIEQPLAVAGDLADLWRNSYFIGSLKSITRQLVAEVTV